ncbi:serpin peptidase inhibitor%2C clade A (alpha-1 antiproteinase, antitrypsin), member 10a [Xyrichtys novacula]|uniref:Serpin peptidase inhibitor, clade A (Alpha-1 antiproteinase, antitrypsin), member 10a n=1 Tax=Xyrichtys novacula TaxID=13765 RepID=A0AAV1GWX8_XYRNO|nr:serpin peptidase inhibitor%2C clade A (alpha-1 antiproteinase, antitrypsin), member 10a [Xyrichtys novacula]
MTHPIFLSMVGLAFVTLASSQAIDLSLQDLTNRNADFAARLYRTVSSRTDENVFLSPYTLSIGLSALLSTTSGPTQEQLLQGLSLNGLDPQGLPDLVQSLRTLVLQGGLAANMRLGVAIFPSQDFGLSSSYLDTVHTKFGGNAEILDYKVPQDAAETINRWAQDNTGGQIRELLTNLDPQTQLLLTTAATYQVRFNPSFNASETQDDRFFVDKYHVVMVPMMFRADKYFLAYDPSLQCGVLKLPMSDGAAMLVVLPDEDVDITTVEEDLTGEKIRAWIRQLKKTKLEVQLPRFLLERSYTLRDALKNLGVTQVFQDDAEIINMGGATGPKVTEVYHKSVMAVDENTDGVTPGGAVNAFTTLPPRLTINRPFIFVIYQQTSSSVLFMGRVTDPTKK